MRGKLAAALCFVMVGLVACAQGTDGGGGGDDDDDVPAEVCGDTVCTAGESHATCPDDCEESSATCGDGACNGTETINTCPADCNGGGGGPDAGGGATCGDGQCNNGETSVSCPQDCQVTPTCGDGNCSGGETATSCPADCTGGGGGTAMCGDFTCDVAAGECDVLDLGCLFDCAGNMQCTCPHDVCTAGDALSSDCGSCEEAVCAADGWCCSFAWDASCVALVAANCPGQTCP